MKYTSNSKKMLVYCWTCDFQDFKFSQGKVRTINRLGSISNHLSMAYLLSNMCTKITGIGQQLLKLSLVVGWYPFLRHSVDIPYRLVTYSMTSHDLKRVQDHFKSPIWAVVCCLVYLFIISGELLLQDHDSFTTNISLINITSGNRIVLVGMYYCAKVHSPARVGAVE